MSGCSSRQRREFLLDGLVEGVRARNRTRRLNRRKGRHVASESSLSGRIISARRWGERWLLASLFSTETRWTEWTSLPSTKGHAAMQHTNRGGVEGTGTCRAAWRPLTSGETRMPSERPYPGQLWKHDSTHVIVVAVHPNTVTYEFLSGGQSVTQRLDVFLAAFTRLRR